MSTRAETPVSFVANARGQRLAYRYSPGRGPTVVFLCGYASDMEGTKAQFLDEHCRASDRAYLRLDYAGHGLSEGRFVEGSIGDWADDAITVLDELDDRQIVLVGSSMGAWIMLLVALARVARVAGLLGVASAPDFTSELLWCDLSDAERQTLRDDGQLFRHSEYVDNPYPITWKLIEDGRRWCLLDGPIALRCPVRLVHGLRDTDVPWETSVRLAKQLTSTDVELRIIKEGEHRLSRPDDLLVIAETLDELLERL